MSEIILLHEILEQKIRKEKELEYYEEQLKELEKKMWFIKKEIDVTNMCIKIIEEEKADIIAGRLLSNDEEGTT